MQDLGWAIGQSQNARRVMPSALPVFYRFEEIKPQADKNRGQQEKTLERGKRKRGRGRPLLWLLRITVVLGASQD